MSEYIAGELLYEGQGYDDYLESRESEDEDE